MAIQLGALKCSIKAVKQADFHKLKYEFLMEIVYGAPPLTIQFWNGIIGCFAKQQLRPAVKKTFKRGNLNLSFRHRIKCLIKTFFSLRNFSWIHIAFLQASRSTIFLVALILVTLVLSVAFIGRSAKFIIAKYNFSFWMNSASVIASSHAGPVEQMQPSRKRLFKANQVQNVFLLLLLCRHP